MKLALQQPSNDVLDAIAKLRTMPNDAPWVDKFYAATEAMELVVQGYACARPEPPQVVMAQLILDVAWSTRPEQP